MAAASPATARDDHMASRDSPIAEALHHSRPTFASALPLPLLRRLFFKAVSSGLTGHNSALQLFPAAHGATLGFGNSKSSISW
jgi:hypothetical protein